MLVYGRIMGTEVQVKILIVDDVPEKRLAVEAVLQELGQKIVSVGSGSEALRQILQEDFAVILLDVNMRDLDGFEMAALIRQRQRSEHTPIIFLTDSPDDAYATRGYSLGAVDYILTPVMPDVLRTKVGVFVDLFRMTEQVKRQAEAASGIGPTSMRPDLQRNSPIARRTNFWPTLAMNYAHR